jgi:hypothetical protein
VLKQQQNNNIWQKPKIKPQAVGCSCFIIVVSFGQCPKETTIIKQQKCYSNGNNRLVPSILVTKSQFMKADKEIKKSKCQDI